MKQLKTYRTFPQFYALSFDVMLIWAHTELTRSNSRSKKTEKTNIPKELLTPNLGPYGAHQVGICS